MFNFFVKCKQKNNTYIIKTTATSLALIFIVVKELNLRINGVSPYNSNIFNGAEGRLKFLDQIQEYPHICVVAGDETRQYQPDGFKWRFLQIDIRCYINEEDSVSALDELLEDVETVLEENSRLLYHDRNGLEQYTHQITIISIDTDEGVLDPLGVGEILIEVRY